MSGHGQVFVGPLDDFLNPPDTDDGYSEAEEAAYWAALDELDDDTDQPEPNRRPRPSRDDECGHGRYMTDPCDACGRPDDEEDTP